MDALTVKTPTEPEHSFTYEDGTIVKFKEFTPHRNSRISCGQPGKHPGEHSGTISVLVPEALTQWVQSYRWGEPPIDHKYVKETQIGILDYKMSLGIPGGAYVPLKWNKAMRRFDVYVAGLINEKLILNKAFTNPEVIAAVEKPEKVEEVVTA